MKRPVLQGLVVANLILGFSVPGWAQQPMPQQPMPQQPMPQMPVPQQLDFGKTEYQSSCAACHGVDGKGTGPVADSLKAKPVDLTTIAKENNGVFPFGRLYDIIDGRQAVKFHGDRDMPIWGFRYTPAPIPGINPVAPYFLDPLYDREPVIRSRILSVIDYLYRIQVK